MTRLSAAALATLLASPLVTTAAAQTKTLQVRPRPSPPASRPSTRRRRTLTLKGRKATTSTSRPGPTSRASTRSRSATRFTARLPRERRAAPEGARREIRRQRHRRGRRAPAPAPAAPLPPSAPSPRRSPRSTRTSLQSPSPARHNWKYSSRVEDKKALAKVKVGDKVDITWTAALLVSLDTPKWPSGRHRRWLPRRAGERAVTTCGAHDDGGRRSPGRGGMAGPRTGDSAGRRDGPCRCARRPAGAR